MNHTPKKVFVLKVDEYIEITFQELYEMRKNDSSFRERKFLFEDGFLMEARPQEYMAIKSEKRRQRYQKNSPQRMMCLSTICRKKRSPPSQ